MVDNTAACEIIDSRLPLKKRRINSTLNEAPLDFSLPSRERAKLELRSRACSSSPCSSKSSMVSDVEIEEDQRVPSNPKCNAGSPLQTMPIDLSIRSRRTQQSSEPARDRDPKDEGGGYVINPTTGNRCKRNYKNVTVEKRCEANARERTRVQTIAATFEELRGLLPCEDDAKLSKLAILRIASKYIQYLGALMGKDFSGKAKCGEFVSPSTHSLIAVFGVSGGLFLLFVILPLFYFWFLDPFLIKKFLLPSKHTTSREIMEENRTTIEHPEFEADEAKDRKDIRFDPVLYEKREKFKNFDDQHRAITPGKGELPTMKKVFKRDQSEEKEQSTQREYSLKTAILKV
uniref:BHLH domain-containing protein n=1 Tax=Ascaris lumbricoides TaxID=6252 RepID=A0A9J2PSS4_ASCLU